MLDRVGDVLVVATAKCLGIVNVPRIIDRATRHTTTAPYNYVYWK